LVVLEVQVEEVGHMEVQQQGLEELEIHLLQVHLKDKMVDQFMQHPVVQLLLQEAVELEELEEHLQDHQKIQEALAVELEELE
jgi:hypothetical protein